MIEAAHDPAAKGPIPMRPQIHDYIAMELETAIAARPYYIPAADAKRFSYLRRSPPLPDEERS
jgi:hypothetical protein